MIASSLLGLENIYSHRIRQIEVRNYYLQLTGSFAFFLNIWQGSISSGVFKVILLSTRDDVLIFQIIWQCLATVASPHREKCVESIVSSSSDKGPALSHMVSSDFCFRSNRTDSLLLCNLQQAETKSSQK